MSLVFKAWSKTLYLDFDKYEEGHCVYNNKYLIKDSYKPAGPQKHGEYSLSIESSMIRNENDLRKEAAAIRNIAHCITLLSKCVLGGALNTPERSMNSFTRTFILPSDMPKGWQCNYKDVEKSVTRKGVHLIVDSVTDIQYYALERSPFNDYITALKNYGKLPKSIKDLLTIINDVDLVSYSARYMLIGKALEIVDALYPLNNGKDRRIEQFFPELIDIFNGTTIKDLMNLANNRQESRHYVKKKASLTPHDAMTNYELKKYYDLSNNLCLYIIRRELGLEPVEITD